MKSQTIHELGPQQREAAEKFLGRSLADFHKVAIRVGRSGADIVVRFFGGGPKGATEPIPGKWNVPGCFAVLTDLSHAEQVEFDTTMSQPVSLSRPA